MQSMDLPSAKHSDLPTMLAPITAAAAICGHCWEDTMHNLITTRTLIVVLAVTMAGCSSIRSRYDTAEQDWTVYPGIQRDGADMVGTLTGEVRPLWTSALVGPVLLADVPFSLVTDTFALPYDLYAIGTAGKNPSPPSAP